MNRTLSHDGHNASLGLTTSEVEQRIRQGQINQVSERTSRTYGEILRANVFTLFNAILATLLVLILLFGSVKDALFGLVLVFNSLIGIIQEIRAKRTLDRLALIHRPTVRVVRDGRVGSIPIKQIVQGDMIELATGDQLVVDGKVISSEGLEIDESLLSGESVPVLKIKGDEVHSGSFVVAGTGQFQTTQVGNQTYAQKLIGEARQFTLTRSELLTGINTFLRYVIIAMIVVAPLLLITQLKVARSMYEALPMVVAGLVGMVPQGLVLLTNIAFALSVISLGRREVLVNELPAVEGLARVDVVCFDKTGTLTTGTITLQRIEKLDQQTDIEEALRTFTKIPAPNATLLALAKAFPGDKTSITETVVPFSSERKWSAVRSGGNRIWILGAPEIILQNLPNAESLLTRVTGWAESGFRVLLLGYTTEIVTPERLPSTFTPSAFLLFEEQLREDAQATLSYFKKQGVMIKIISGDNPRTVAAISAQAGAPDPYGPIDAKHLPEHPEELSNIMEQHTIFGRVTPQQKRMMIKALQANGHVVAMTGDGVNDVLALKEADLGIAMGTGASATKAVAQVVLLDSQFSTLPLIVAEGRKVIANIERVANLFLTKTAYITLLAIAVSITLWPFPFLPRHLTLIDGLTIGIPGFFLALAPNAKRYQPGFMRRVLHFVIPAGFATAAATFAAYGIARVQITTHPNQITAASFLALGLVGLWVLHILSRPSTFWRLMLQVTMTGMLIGVMFLPMTQNFFGIELPSLSMSLEVLMISAIFIGLLEYVLKLTRNLREA